MTTIKKKKKNLNKKIKSLKKMKNLNLPIFKHLQAIYLNQKQSLDHLYC